MSIAVAQPISTQPFGYQKLRQPVVEKFVQKEEEILTLREKQLKSIEVLTQYMEDLKAGRPVENMSPSNDPYFLNPEVIACMIRGEREILEGRVCGGNSMRDIIGEWDTE
jgi:hypothetical protein